MPGSLLDVREVKLWAALLGRGVAGLLCGMVLMSASAGRLSVDRMAATFAVYLLVDGALALYSAKRARRARPYLLALVGLVDVVAAASAVALASVMSLRLIAGARAIVTGACDARWARRHEVSDPLTLGGVAAVALGIVLLLAWPGPGTQALPWLIGLQVMVSGSLYVGGALSELRRADAASLAA